MNRCPDALALLPGYVEDELSAAEHRRVQGHLSICAACRHEEAQYRQAMAALRAPRGLQPHGDLYAGFARKLARYGAGRSRFRGQMRWATAAAGVLVAVIAGATILRPRFYLEQAQVSEQKSMIARSVGADSKVGPSTIAMSGVPASGPSTTAGKREVKSNIAPPLRDDPMAPLPDREDGSRRIARAAHLRHREQSVIAAQIPPASNLSADREEFVKIQPKERLSAAEMIRKQNTESEVAVFSAHAPSPAAGMDGTEPKPTEVYVSNRPVGQHEGNKLPAIVGGASTPATAPPVVPSGNEALRATSADLSLRQQAAKTPADSDRVPGVVPTPTYDSQVAARKTEAGLQGQEQEARVRVNGAVASIRTGGRIDRMGRRILNVNIRMRPAFTPPRR